MPKVKRTGQQRKLEAYVAANQQSELHTIVDPRLFRAMQNVFVSALQASRNDTTVREQIAQLSLEIKMQSIARYGYYTADAEELSELLRRTDPNRKEEQRAPARDVFEYLQKVLDSNHYYAAITMREIWTSFSRFLTIATRGLEQGGGNKRANVLQPLDVMNDDTWEDYKHHFKPWASAASRRSTERRRAGNVSNFEIVHRVIVDERFPPEVDQIFDLRPGGALKTLKFELHSMYERMGPPEGTDVVRVFVSPESPVPVAA